jgi:transposase
MTLYAAFDLHSNNNYLAIVDQTGKRIFKKKLMNDPEIILNALKPHQQEMAAVTVESTFNWYWLVDLLQEAGYDARLANPAAIQKYSGLKHSDDTSDAFWLADLLRLGIMPEGYIYPKEQRSTRDLLRKRAHLVRLRTSLILSLQNSITRNRGTQLSAKAIKQLTQDNVAPFFESQSEMALAGKASKETIDYLTRQIQRIERAVESMAMVHDPVGYRCLQTVSGVGKILGLTIMLETGPIDRFPTVGNYASYCRKVPSRWTSNGKNKGKGNKKSGNRHLAWAFSEVAEMAIRFDATARKFYHRKASKTSFMAARAALAHKMARAAYYVMRDHVPFDPKKLFG